MIVLGLLGAALATAALALFAFRLAGVALPVAIGLASLFALLQRGVDPVLAIAAGFLLGVLTLVAGQVAFARTRSLAMRSSIAATFIVPAGLLGYHVAADVVSLTTASQAARVIVGTGGAIAVAWAALRHLIDGSNAIGSPIRQVGLADPNGAG